MKTTFIIVGIALLLAVPLSIAEPYKGPVSSTNCAGGVHTGSTCLRIPAGATSVSPFVTDMVFGSEPGTVQFVTANGNIAVNFCPGDVLPIPSGATRVTVGVLVSTPADTTLCPGLAFGTTGDVGATFS